MVPPKINYYKQQHINCDKPKWKIRQLFTLFKVQMLQDTNHFEEKSCVILEEIIQHPQHILFYSTHSFLFTFTSQEHQHENSFFNRWQST